MTAASTPEGQKYGYVFHNCRLTAAEGVDKVYLGRPWRPYANTVFIDCELPLETLRQHRLHRLRARLPHPSRRLEELAPGALALR